MESVNQLIAVVKEPEIQQALIEVQQGLQKVLDKFDNTGMRDIDSLIEVVSELRDVTDKLTDALQKLRPVRRAAALLIWRTSCSCSRACR